MLTEKSMFLVILSSLIFTLADPWLVSSSAIRNDVIETLISRLELKRVSPTVQVSAAKGVLERLLPSHIESFHLLIIPKSSCGGKNCFIIENYDNSSSNGPEITIKGTTGVEIASGIHWYLKYFCDAHVSWEKTGGVQVASVPKPGSLPRVKIDGITMQRPVPLSYYQNVVTSSYSYVWWSWKRWEKELDWMALQGINMPLAFTGQESIWKRVLMKYNVTEEDLHDFFGGPAFLAWARMGNLHGWGGPLTQNWLDQQLILQKKILARMLELGMNPVLPSFSGNVPAAFRRLFPSANITQLGNWNTVGKDPRWCCTYLLSPSQPLFIELGEAFVKEQILEYGDVTDVYSCDTFNENSPPTDDPEYISSLGAAIYAAMSKADADAVWLMQGWLFYSDSLFWKPPQMKALLHSVPFGKMLVIDLFAEIKPIWSSSHQFFGTPYIWCMLHNFGGNIEMYGSLDSLASGPINARLSQNSTMVGVGMCMEGIEQNPVVYELMSEMSFLNDTVSTEDWLNKYVLRRYGCVVPAMTNAWQILHRTIYNCTDGIADHNTDYIVKLPDVDPSNASYFPLPHLWYPLQESVDALRLFIDAGESLAASDAYQYDLVDLTRQVLSKLANQAYVDSIAAFRNNDEDGVLVHSQKFLMLILDIDLLLGSHEGFLLGPWLQNAKDLALNADELKQYEWNARTQVTMWYDTSRTEQSNLHDYANKFWSGLVKDYYHRRADMYFGRLITSLKDGGRFDLEDWREEWIAYSSAWQSGNNLYPVDKNGCPLAIATSLFRKYFHSLPRDVL